ncbi:MAG: hypothetical protein B6A08_02885 [Sorangiineae bacterium NIC37A_2]|jgi:hypothetical protein|nr:MAG: hypothetical protein B6A08_02885 [Sorangiineae bacterium NIC37A_2]
MADQHHSKSDSHGGHDAAPKLTDSIRLSGADLSLSKTAFAVGVVGIGGAIALGGGLFGKQFQHSYLTAFMWALSITLGALFWVTLQHLVNARWSIVVRRLGEFLAQGVVLLALLAIPLLIPVLQHNDTLFRWLNHDTIHGISSKTAYLNPSFFLGRMVFYFAYFALMATFWLKKSREQEKGGGEELTRSLQGKAAPAMIVFALSVTFCAIDFLMTLDPMWFSTIFGVYYFSTCVLTFHSVLALFAMWLQKKGHLTSAITTEHYHDIGKMMFAFTAFWTYIGFSQFMLIWYANIPEETAWFRDRLEGNWLSATLVLAAAHFVIPFFGMMSREIKRNKTTLGFWAVWILVICWFDMYWLVAPNLHKGGMAIGLVDILAWVGVAGLLLGFVLSKAKDTNLIPTGDPRLGRSLTFQNI